MSGTTGRRARVCADMRGSCAGLSRKREDFFAVDSYSRGLPSQARDAILPPAMRRDAFLALLVSGFLGLTVLTVGCRREETHDERRMRMWREDFKVCDRFAIKREEARELLAYNPEATQVERARESERALKDLMKDLPDKGKRWDADRRACLRGRDWKDEWIDDMTAKMRAEDDAKEKKEPWMR